MSALSRKDLLPNSMEARKRLDPLRASRIPPHSILGPHGHTNLHALESSRGGGRRVEVDCRARLRSLWGSLHERADSPAPPVGSLACQRRISGGYSEHGVNSQHRAGRGIFQNAVWHQPSRRPGSETDMGLGRWTEYKIVMISHLGDNSIKQPISSRSSPGSIDRIVT